MKRIGLANNLGTIVGDAQIGFDKPHEDFDYLYNEDTEMCDIYAPRVEVRIVGRICGSDTETFEEELRKFVKSFLM